MKKCFIILLTLLIQHIAASAQTSFSIDDFSIQTGETKAITINMSCTEDIQGFQLDLHIPEGLSFVTSGDNKPSLTSWGANHTLSSRVLTSGSVYRFIVASLSGATFAKGSGAVLAVYVTASADAQEGQYTATLENITVSGTETVKQVIERVEWNCNIVKPSPVTPDTDISAYDNIIYIDKTEGFAGGMTKLVAKMNNNVEVAGYQFDLYLPERITIAEDEDGISMVYLSTERTTSKKTNYFDSSMQPDGALRVLCSTSAKNPQTGNLYTFNGTSGAVAEIMVNIPDDCPAGDYPIILRTVEMSGITGIPYRVSYVKTTLTVSDYIPGDANGDGVISVSDFTTVASYILGNTPEVFVEKAADVNKDGIISVSDLTAIANIILHGNQ